MRLDTILDTLPPPGALGPLAILGPRTPAEPVREMGLLAASLIAGDGLRDVSFVGDGLPRLEPALGVGGVTEVAGGAGGGVVGA